jgi:hypothetical protein
MKRFSKVFTYTKNSDGSYQYKGESLNTGRIFTERNTPRQAATYMRLFRSNKDRYDMCSLGKGKFLVTLRLR